MSTQSGFELVLEVLPIDRVTYPELVRHQQDGGIAVGAGPNVILA